MKIKIKDAARILEVSEQFVRIGLQRKLFPFGFAIRPYLGQKYTYFISPAQFAEYTGLTMQELEKRCEQ